VTIPASARAITGNATVVNNGFANGGSLKLYPGDINQVVTRKTSIMWQSNHPECFYCEIRFKRSL
jgi:hypothetical protein